MIVHTYRDRDGAWRARADSDDIRVRSAPFQNVVGKHTRDGELEAIRQVTVALRVLKGRKQTGHFIVTPYGEVVARDNGAMRQEETEERSGSQLAEMAEVIHDEVASQ